MAGLLLATLQLAGPQQAFLQLAGLQQGTEHMWQAYCRLFSTLVRPSAAGWLHLASLLQAVLQLTGPQQAFLQLAGLQQSAERIWHAYSGCAGQAFCC